MTVPHERAVPGRGSRPRLVSGQHPLPGSVPGPDQLPRLPQPRRRRRVQKAWELALDPNPMASICGSVCAAPCETACRRKEVDKPLSIRYVKKFLSDWTHQNVTVD